MTAEPLAGTATQATVWLAVEQPGPWGPRVLGDAADSHLDPALHDLLAAAGHVEGARVVVVREPAHHPDRRVGGRRAVLLASVVPGARWLVSTQCDDSAAVGALDLVGSLRRAVNGAPPTWGEAVPHPVVLVCTNGRRDRCCAVLGREVAVHLHAALRGQVWECSHLGGHRFAPTVLVMPAGAMYGQLGPASAVGVITEVGRHRLPVHNLRGLCALAPEQQAADVFVRRRDAVVDLDGVREHASSVEADGSWRVQVRTDAGVHTVGVRHVRGDVAAESCGAQPVVQHPLRVDTLVDQAEDGVET